MKKRKELDALVSNGKVGGGKRLAIKKGSGSCSAHELLRHDTESSDMEDFSILQPRRKGRKKKGSRLCLTSVCLPLCQFILVTTSFLVSGALIWLHIGLREDIDLLRAHLQKVEAGNRNTPEALHVIHSKLKQLDSNVTMLYLEVRKNIVDIENVTSEVNLLKDVAKHIKDSIASAPAIQQLPKDVHSLSESVVSFGSKINALESNIKELKDQQSSIQTTAQNLSGELDNVKMTIQEITNSTDLQSKSFVNTSAKELKFQSAIQETNQTVVQLQWELTNIGKSLSWMNSTVIDQLKLYKDLPSRVETINNAVIMLVNDTNTQSARMLALENFIYPNLTLRVEQMEQAKEWPLMKPGTLDIEEVINRSLAGAIIRVINDVFHGDIHTNASSNNIQSLEQTHDVLVLLAALLRQFEQIPKTYIMSNKNASELVTALLNKTFNGLMGTRDSKIESMELELKNLLQCVPCKSNTKDAANSEKVTTPFSQYTSSQETVPSTVSEA